MITILDVISNLIDKLLKFLYDNVLHYIYDIWYTYKSKRIITDINGCDINIIATYPFDKVGQFNISKLNLGFKISVPCDIAYQLKDYKFYTDYSEGCRNSNAIGDKLESFINEHYADSISDPKEFIYKVSLDTAYSFLNDLQKGKSKSNNTILGIDTIEKGKKNLLNIRLFTTDYFTYHCIVAIYKKLYAINATPFDVNSLKDVHRLSPFLSCFGIGGFVSIQILNKRYTIVTKRSSTAACPNYWHTSFEETFDIRDNNSTQGRTPTPSLLSCLLRGIEEELGFSLKEYSYQIRNSCIFVIKNHSRLETAVYIDLRIHITSQEELNSLINHIRFASDTENENSQIMIIPYNELHTFYQEKLNSGELVTPEALFFSNFYMGINRKTKILSFLLNFK